MDTTKVLHLGQSVVVVTPTCFQAVQKRDYDRAAYLVEIYSLYCVIEDCYVLHLNNSQVCLPENRFWCGASEHSKFLPLLWQLCWYLQHFTLHHKNQPPEHDACHGARSTTADLVLSALGLESQFEKQHECHSGYAYD